jgi:hypothetical protein
MSADSKEAGTIRLVFELGRADHPRLYDDPIRFPKGTKRINRLRVLAYDGLLAQMSQVVAVGLVSRTVATLIDAEEGSGDVTNDTFAPSHTE